MLKAIYERLGIQTNLDKEKARFIARIKTLLSDHDADMRRYSSSHYQLIRRLIFILGEDEYKNHLPDFVNSKPFEEVLLFCETLLSVLKEPHHRDFYSAVETALDLSVIDLGVMFKEGKFYLQGAKELDEKLVLETLDWLKGFPEAKEGFDGALKEYLNKDYPDAVTKAFSSLESLVKTCLGRDAGLENLIPDLLKKLKLSREWKAILVNYCAYAHEFGSRHGKKDGRSTKADPNEVEAYIYFTGLIMRLIIVNKEGKG
jgi:HEPN domain-containing protein